MKRWFTLGIAISLSASSMSLFGALGTSLETDFLQLREKRDKALAVVSAPINDGYRASLEQLLKRAIEEKDKATAGKIQLELQSLSVKSTVSVPTMTPEMTNLRNLLGGTKWRIDQDKTFLLNADGTSTSSWTPRKGNWKVIDATTLEMDIGNIKRREKVVASQGGSMLTWEKREADELHPQVAKKIVPLPEK